MSKELILRYLVLLEYVIQLFGYILMRVIIANYTS